MKANQKITPLLFYAYWLNMPFFNAASRSDYSQVSLYTKCSKITSLTRALIVTILTHHRKRRKYTGKM